MTAPLFIDHALSSRFEAAEAAELSSLVRAVAARSPERGAAALPLAGGVAAFLAPEVSASRAAGLGMNGPVEDADVTALVDFYRSRGMDARVLVSPFAHPSLLERLGEHGFRLVDLDTLLVRRLAPAERFSVPASDVEVRVAVLADAATWVESSLAGFGMDASPASAASASVFRAAFEAACGGREIVYSMGYRGGELGGTGALHLHGGTGYLFAASTRPAHRGRGVQTALIQARLAWAEEAGCDVAFTRTEPGSASQRNFERLGFSPAYSLALLVKRFAA